MKTEYRVKAEITVTLTPADIEDILVTALEGGIGYWACLDSRSLTFLEAPEDEPVSSTATKIMLNGGMLTFIDVDDHSVEWLLSMDKLLKGVKMYLETYTGIAAIEDGLIDTSMIDSDAADAIIQFALFDELVYG